MSNEMIHRYRRWFEYEKDAQAKVMASLESVPFANRTGADFRKAVSLLGHLVFARRLWLFRLGITTAPVGAPFPENSDLKEIATDWDTVSQLWSDYLNRCDDAEIDRFCEYQSLDSGKYRNRIEDILTQLYGHSWYHRGQIAMLVRSAGGEPAATDLIYWCREKVPGSD